MLETESLFGAPSALLGSTSNLDSMDVEPSEPSQSSSGFVLGDLLGGPANTTKVSLLQNETGEYSLVTKCWILTSLEAETNLGGRAEALSGNEFMANGLLSDPCELIIFWLDNLLMSALSNASPGAVFSVAHHANPDTVPRQALTLLLRDIALIFNTM